MTAQFGVQPLREGDLPLAASRCTSTATSSWVRAAVLLDTGMGISNIRAAVEKITDLRYSWSTAITTSITWAAITCSTTSPSTSWVPGRFRRGRRRTGFPLPRRRRGGARATPCSARSTRRGPRCWHRRCSAAAAGHVRPRRLAQRPHRAYPAAEGWRHAGPGRADELHTPGHTPDCICLLDDEDRILFTGDTIDTGPIYAQFEESSLDSFAASTKKLLA